MDFFDQPFSKLNFKHYILRGGFFATVVLGITSCFVIENRFTAVAPGIWRATLQLVPKEVVMRQANEIHSARQLLTQKEKKTLPDAVKMEEATEGELPFLFEVKYVNDTSFYIELINGEERIKVEPQDIKHGRNKQTGKDTLRIDFPVFGSYITALYQERVIEGEWVVPAKNQHIPFTARYGQNRRFTTISKPPVADLTGKWDCTFDLAGKEPYKAIGELAQNGNILRGTFRTETGDYRFLDGEIQGDKLYLSCFDGSHAFLFEGKIRQDGHLDGAFRSGQGEPEIWAGSRNDDAELKDANSLTTANTEGAISFSFPNADGKRISLSDYGNKVKILQLMGTWCPNCFDETKFIVNYLNQNPSVKEKVAVIPLAFERNAEVAATQVATYRRRMNVPYDILIAGTTTKKDSASKSLPFLSKVVAYPTMVFLDKNNRVRRIHTGFDGPATSKYAQFSKEFDEFLKTLIAE
ncbi:MAG: TlpA family protein disulfide reductase [Saprospiraceae bacterium]|nr:TlpA family protein disulfide reductase [Saprospiraceae bacterium]